MLNGAAISWRLRDNPYMLSRVQFIAAGSVVQEVIFLRRLLSELRFPQQTSTPIFADNETCIRWSQGAVGGSERAKHIDLRRHFVHAASDQGILQLRKVDSKLNSSDILTKPFVDIPLFQRHRQSLMGF